MKQAIKQYIDEFGIDGINQLMEWIMEYHPLKHNPVSQIKYVPIKSVIANSYNPNAVAKNELKLLSVSIDHDGYTQPIVVIQDGDEFVIVDGFHRYFVMKTNDDINKRNEGLIPVVILSKDINDRMASTIRHNRARGKHSVGGMANIVLEMISNGWSDDQICNELGLEVDELVRLKYVSGVDKLFKDREYSQSYKETYQLNEERKVNETEPRD